MKKIIFLICAAISNTALNSAWADLETQPYIEPRGNGTELTPRIKQELREFSKFKDDILAFITEECPHGAYTISTMRPGVTLKKPLIFSIIDAGSIDALKAFINARPSDIYATLGEGFDNLENHNALDYTAFYSSKIKNQAIVKGILKQAGLSHSSAYKPASQTPKKDTTSTTDNTNTPTYDGWSVHGRTSDSDKQSKGVWNGLRYE